MSALGGPTATNTAVASQSTYYNRPECRKQEANKCCLAELQAAQGNMSLELSNHDSQLDTADDLDSLFEYPDDEEPSANEALVVKTTARTHARRRSFPELPHYVWLLVWELAHPKVLITSSMLNKDFHEYLDRPGSDHLWKRARVREMGEKMPDPPTGMTERRFATLLFDTSCDFQYSTCGNSYCRKVQWQFKVRLCEPCLDARIEKVCRSLYLLYFTDWDSLHTSLLFLSTATPTTCSPG